MTKHAISVWSNYGHRFISEDGGSHESCLTCGALYELRETPASSYDADYCNSSGLEPDHCAADTKMVHGYPGERPCECDGGCVHCDHDCNCLLCV